MGEVNRSPAGGVLDSCSYSSVLWDGVTYCKVTAKLNTMKTPCVAQEIATCGHREPLESSE